MAFAIDKEKCIGCGACASECPVECIKEDGGKFAIDADQCVECGSCASVCPVEAPAQA